MKPPYLFCVIREAFAALRLPSFAFMLFLILPAPLRAQVVINELMANNMSTLTNKAGNFGDWIELYNPTAAAINISGWSLTDNPTTNKFFFPSITLLQPHGHLIVWCDSDTGLGEFHTGFSLSASGEYVGLSAPTGRVDSITFGLQLADMSVGRIPDGPGGTWGLNLPTPGLTNELKLVSKIFETNGAVIITNLFLNEWVATNSTGNSNDWLEVYNQATNPVNLAGIVFTTTAPTNIPPFPPSAVTNTPMRPLTFIEGSGYVQFFCVGSKSVKNGDDLDFKLSHTSGEIVSLYPVAGQTNVYIDRISFPGISTVPNYWPTDSVNVGVSYGRLPDGGTNIVQFARNRTTPAASNFQPITNVVINEALTHTDPPLEDAIELYNPTASNVDISYWWISNRPNNPYKFQIPAGTIITAFTYRVFYEQQGVNTLPHKGFNTSGTGNDPDFTLNSAHGDSVYLFTGDSSGQITGFRRGIDFGAAEHGFSFGRYITSVGVDITAMSVTTFGHDNPVSTADFRLGMGLTNAYPKMGPLIINEVMYHPPDIFTGTNFIDDGLNEYIEVYNITTNTIRLYDTNGLYFDSSVGFYADGRTNTWKLRGMVGFDFPTNTQLAAGAFLLLVNFDPILDSAQLTSFRNKYGVPAGIPVFGPYTGGKLKNGGGSLELDKPDPPQPPDHPDFKFVPYIQVDKVNFNDHAPWPTGPDGSGTSLHRLVPERYGNEPTNWESAFPTPGWEPVRIDSSYQAGNSYVISFRTLAGSSYSLQYKTNLNAATWTRATNINSMVNSTMQQVTTTLSNTNRFYRLVSPAQ